MPELPEVETIVRGLNRKLKNRTIKDLWTDWPKYFNPVRGRSPQAPLEIRRSEVSADAPGIGSLTGQGGRSSLRHDVGGAASNDEMLALSDLRRFAKVLCGPREIITNLPDLRNLGPDPLEQEFTYKKFKELFYPPHGAVLGIFQLNLWFEPLILGYLVCLLLTSLKISRNSF